MLTENTALASLNTCNSNQNFFFFLGWARPDELMVSSGWARPINYKLQAVKIIIFTGMLDAWDNIGYNYRWSIHKLAGDETCKMDQFKQLAGHQLKRGPTGPGERAPAGTIESRKHEH